MTMISQLLQTVMRIGFSPKSLLGESDSGHSQMGNRNARSVKEKKNGSKYAKTMPHTNIHHTTNQLSIGIIQHMFTKRHVHNTGYWVTEGERER